MTIHKKGSRFAARHDIYTRKDGLVPTKGQTVVEMRIAIRLPKGTLATRSRMASRIRIAVGGGVIDTDYTRYVNIILPHHGQAD